MSPKKKIRVMKETANELCTSVLAAAGFLAALTLVVRLGALSAASSSECSVLLSDWSSERELSCDSVSAGMGVARTKENNKDGHRLDIISLSTLQHVLYHIFFFFFLLIILR